MIKIAVCDDEIVAAENLKQMLEKILVKTDKETSISVYSSGSDLLAQSVPADIIFLDIEMPGMDGIEVGRQIQERNKSSRIIMATCRTERFKEAFQIQAYRFVTKPFIESEVEEALLAALAERIGNRKIEVYAMRQKYSIEEKQIVYIKAEYGYVKICGQNNSFRRETGLKELERELDPRLFARIHRACLINLLYVTGYQNGQVKIGEECFTVSRREQKEFERKYVEFDLKYRKQVER